MFSKTLINDRHTRRFSIAYTESGWEIREERDSRVVRLVACHDWHRVERARRTMAHTLEDLQAAGWRVE